MKNYIILDLEWNQASRRENTIEGIPFEIIEIGAVRLDENLKKTGTFNELIKPRLYSHIHDITRGIIHLTMDDLKDADHFEIVAQKFLDWCGEEPIFCTWGTMDLTELQRNLEYYNFPKLAKGPLPYYDVQKLFSIQCGYGKQRKSLKNAVEELGLKKVMPFHRALSDAEYTAMIFSAIDQDVLHNISFNIYVPPREAKQEVHIVFDNYAKYISREFDDKKILLGDREVMSTKCYICRKNLRRKIKWFTGDGKIYLAVAKCDKHGYLKSKIRISKSNKDKFFVVKTSKFILPEEVEIIKNKKIKAEKRHRPE